MDTLQPRGWAQTDQGLRYWNGTSWADRNHTFKGVRIPGICGWREPVTPRGYGLSNLMRLGLFVLLSWAVYLGFLGLFIACVVVAFGLRMVLIETDRVRYARQTTAADRAAVEWSHDAGREITEAAAALHGWCLSVHTGMALMSYSLNMDTAAAPMDFVTLPVAVTSKGMGKAYTTYAEYKACKLLRPELPSLMAKYCAALTTCSDRRQRKLLEAKHAITYDLIRRSAALVDS